MNNPKIEPKLITLEIVRKFQNKINATYEEMLEYEAPKVGPEETRILVNWYFIEDALEHVKARLALLDDQLVAYQNKKEKLYDQKGTKI